MAAGHLASILIILLSAGGTRLTDWVAPHVSLLIVISVVIWKLPTGRPWVRRPAMVSQLMTLAFAIASWSSWVPYDVVAGVIGGASVLTLLLLRLPRAPSRPCVITCPSWFYRSAKIGEGGA